MKTKDIITESAKLKEKAPVGIGSQAWSAVKGAFGSAKGKADVDVGTRATQIYNKFNTLALRSGIDMTNVPVKTLKKWFGDEGLVFPKDTVGTATSLNLTDKDTSSQFWKAAAQQAYSKAGTGAKLGSQYNIAQKPKAKKSTAAAGSAAPAGAAAPATQAPQNFQDLKTALANAKATLRPNQINALVRALTR